MRLLTLLEAEAQQHAPGLTACRKESRNLDRFHSEPLGRWVLQLERKLGAGVGGSATFIMICFLQVGVGESAYLCPRRAWPQSQVTTWLVSVRLSVCMCFPSLSYGLCFPAVQTNRIQLRNSICFQPLLVQVINRLV